MADEHVDEYPVSDAVRGKTRTVEIVYNHHNEPGVRLKTITHKLDDDGKIIDTKEKEQYLPHGTMSPYKEEGEQAYEFIKGE